VAGGGALVAALSALEASQGSVTLPAILVAVFGAAATGLATYIKSNTETPPKAPPPKGPQVVERMTQVIPDYQPPTQVIPDYHSPADPMVQVANYSVRDDPEDVAAAYRLPTGFPR